MGDVVLEVAVQEKAYRADRRAAFERFEAIRRETEALTANLHRLVSDAALTRRLGEAAQVSAQRMTWRSAAATMLHAYQIACSDPR